MMLFAQEEPTWWVQVLSTAGVSGTILLLIAVAIYRNAPKIANAFATHLERIDAANEATSQAVVKLTDAAENQHVATSEFARGLWHAANAADAALEHAPETMRTSVQPHINAMRDAVRKQ